MIPKSPQDGLINILKKRGIHDEAVLEAMRTVPREQFVPDTFRDRAWEDTALPIHRHQTISQPSVVALMTQSLRVSARTKVLEIGTGSGYQAAILSRLCRRLYTVERHQTLYKKSQALFKHLRIHNITGIHQDGSFGWPKQAPFERIMVTAAATDIPHHLLDQLSDDGIMVVPVEEGQHTQRLVCLHKNHGDIQVHDLGPVLFVPLVQGVEEA